MKHLGLSLTLLLLVTSPAFAQQAAYVPPQFSEDQWKGLLSALGQMPHDMVEPLVNALRNIEAQAVAAKAAADAPKPKDESK